MRALVGTGRDDGATLLVEVLDADAGRRRELVAEEAQREVAPERTGGRRQRRPHPCGDRGRCRRRAEEDRRHVERGRRTVRPLDGELEVERRGAARRPRVAALQSHRDHAWPRGRRLGPDPVRVDPPGPDPEDVLHGHRVPGVPTAGAQRDLGLGVDEGRRHETGGALLAVGHEGERAQVPRRTSLDERDRRRAPEGVEAGQHAAGRPAEGSGVRHARPAEHDGLPPGEVARLRGDEARALRDEPLRRDGRSVARRGRDVRGELDGPVPERRVGVVGGHEVVDGAPAQLHGGVGRAEAGGEREEGVGRGRQQEQGQR